MGRSSSLRLWFSILVLSVSCGCGRADNPIIGPGPTPAPGPDPTPTATRTEILVGSGDIAQCENSGGRPAEDTARLLDRIDGTIFTTGDNAYPNGSTADYANCYERTWGRHKRRTRPSPGNHEYETPGAIPYFQYFGPNAGEFGLGFYSYNLGAWHIVSLNSVAQLSAGSEQLLWLKDDLTISRPLCTLVYFHHPRFTSGPSGSGRFRDLWREMYGLGVDVVVNGHDHIYERFEPQDADGLATPTGIRAFIAGTGGASLYSMGRAPNSAVRLSMYGVLKFTLRSAGYDWEFIQAPNGQIADTGLGVCH